MTTEQVKKNSPFSTYDFLGYLIPGSTFIASGFFFDRWLASVMPKSEPTLLFNNFANIVQDVNTGKDANALNSIIAIFLIFIVCYTVGHIISTLSSFYVDRYLIKSGFRYPLINFLNEDKNNAIVPPDTIFKTRAVCALLVLYFILLMVLQLVLIHNNLTLNYYKWQLIAGTSGFFLFSLFFPKKLVYSFSYIPSRVGGLVNNHLDMSTKMDEGFRKHVIDYIRSDFSIDLNDAENSRNYSNVYWLMFLKVTEKSPIAQGMLVNWLHLYSYARNTSTAFFLTALYIVVSFILNGQQMFNLDNLQKLSYLYFFFFLFSLLISLILLIRYYYLFSSYYTKFLVRSYFYTTTQEKAEPSNIKSSISEVMPN